MILPSTLNSKNQSLCFRRESTLLRLPAFCSSFSFRFLKLLELCTYSVWHQFLTPNHPYQIYKLSPPPAFNDGIWRFSNTKLLADKRLLWVTIATAPRAYVFMFRISQNYIQVSYLHCLCPEPSRDISKQANEISEDKCSQQHSSAPAGSAEAWGGWAGFTQHSIFYYITHSKPLFFERSLLWEMYTGCWFRITYIQKLLTKNSPSTTMEIEYYLK